MKEMLKVFGCVALVALAGCTTPARFTSSGGPIQILDDGGQPVKVGSGLQERIDGVGARIDKDIERALGKEIESGNFRREYTVLTDSQIKSYFTDPPLSDEDMPAVRSVVKCVTRHWVRTIVWPAWAKSNAEAVLPEAGKALAENDFARARSIAGGVKVTGVPEVDEEMYSLLVSRFVNGRVNPAEWAKIEERVRADVKRHLGNKKFSDALKYVEGVRPLAIPEKAKGTVWAFKNSDSVDAPVTVKGRSQLCLGLVALNRRLAALKKQLSDEILSARKVDAEAKLKVFLGTFAKQVVVAVFEKRFDEARAMIRDVEQKNDAWWDEKVYLARVGLLNSVVNPNQFEYAKSEARSVIERFVEDKKFAEAIGYVENYPYVHDTYQQILDSLNHLESAMVDMTVEQEPAAKYVASVRGNLMSILDRRDGTNRAERANFDLTKVEKALGELHKGYLAQHYSEGAAKTLMDAIRAEVLKMLNHELPPMTTWEMNSALRKFLSESLKGLRVYERDYAAEQDEAAKKAKFAKLYASLKSDVFFDMQIALAEGANVKDAPRDRMSAVLGDYARIMRCLKVAQAIAPEEAVTLLVGSVYLSQPQVFELALQMGADVDAVARRDPLRRPALLLAVETGHDTFFKKIVDAGARMDVLDVNGDTVLHYAARRGDLLVLRTVSAIVDLATRNNAGETPLYSAVRLNQLASVRFMLDLVKDRSAEYVALENKDGDTAFAVACKCDSHMLLDTLEAAGAKYDERDLAKAAGRHSLGAVQWLVEHRMDVNSPEMGKVGNLNTAVLDYLTAEGYVPNMSEKAAPPTQTVAPSAK